MKSKRKKLIKELDHVFGDYIRHRDKGKCFSCNHPPFDPKNRIDLHPGHMFSRRYLSTRWDEDNVFAQCRGCNMKQNLTGNGSAVLKVIDMIGKERVWCVERKTKQITKLTLTDLKQLIETYEQKLIDIKATNLTTE